MDQGSIVEEGPPRQLFEQPEHERTRAFLRKLADRSGAADGSDGSGRRLRPRPGLLPGAHVTAIDRGKRAALCRPTQRHGIVLRRAQQFG